MSIAATKPFFELAAALPEHLSLGAGLAQGLASLPAACLAPDAVDFVDLLESLSRVSPVSNLKMRTQKSSAPAGTQMTHCYKVVEI